MSGQMRNLNPGQNQKPHVVGEKVKVYFSGFGIPANKVIPGSNLSGGRAKEKAS